MIPRQTLLTHLPEIKLKQYQTLVGPIHLEIGAPTESRPLCLNDVLCNSVT